jgi:hypothetical protein
MLLLLIEYKISSVPEAIAECQTSLRIYTRNLYLFPPADTTIRGFIQSLLSDGCEPKLFSELDDVDVQFKHVVTHSNKLKFAEDEGENSGESLIDFRVFIALGARWVADEQDESNDENVKAHIEGVMVAEYSMDEDPGEKTLEAFALKNAS